MSLRLALAALVIGAIAGGAAVVLWGYGPWLALGIFILTAWAFVRRGRWAELPWVLVGGGFLPVALLWGAASNTDPTFHYSPETGPAFAIAAVVLAVGIVLSFAGLLVQTRMGRAGVGIHRTR